MPAAREARHPAAIGVLVVVVAFLAAGALVAFSWARRLRLERELARTQSRLEEARSELSSRSEARNGGLSLESARRGEELSAARENEREARARSADLERERTRILRRLEEKTAELFRRHQRIVELQDEVESLMRRRLAAADAAGAREQKLRREYEAALRDERERRETLEKKLGALVEITALRDRLRRLVEEMERQVHAERARGSPSPEQAR